MYLFKRGVGGQIQRSVKTPWKKRVLQLQGGGEKKPSPGRDPRAGVPDRTIEKLLGNGASKEAKIRAKEAAGRKGEIESTVGKRQKQKLEDVLSYI